MNKRLIYKALLSLSGIVSLAAAVFLYFAQTVDYDLSIQHFAKGSPHALGAVICIFISMVLGLAAGWIRTKDAEHAHFAKPSAFGVFASTITAFMMFASFILSIRKLSEGLPLLELLQLVLMVLSAAFFFLVLSGDRKSGGGFALLSLCPMLYALASILVIYFDTTYGMNAPIKAYYLLLYISMSLFFSSEARAALNRTHPFTYVFFGVLCLIFTSAVGISQLAIALYDTVGHGFSVINCAVWIAVALFTFTRLWFFDAPMQVPDAAIPAEAADTQNDTTEEDANGAE